MKQYKLYCFINVFGISPTFLLPVFKSNYKYFFQNILENKITSFSVANMCLFKSCKKYKVKEDRFVSYGSPPIYGVEELKNNGFIYGDRNDIIRFYINNKDEIKLYPHFFKAIGAFLEENVDAASEIKNFLNYKKNQEISQKYIRTIPTDLTYSFKKINSDNFEIPLTIYHDIFNTNDISLHDAIEFEFYNYENMLNWNIGNGKISLIESHDEILLLENGYKNFAIKSNCIFKTDNIFVAWTSIRRSNNIFNIPVICYDKPESSAVPFSIQIELLDYIMNNEVVFDTITIHKVLMYLSIKNSEYNYITLSDVKEMLMTEWKLNILNTFSIEDEAKCLSDVYDISDDTFFFGIKKIMSELYVAVAQDAVSDNLFFLISKGSFDNKDLTNFIKTLYNIKKNTITLIPCCDESEQGVFNDEFSEWLNLNDDICTINGFHLFRKKGI